MVGAASVIFCDIGGVLVLNQAPRLYHEFEVLHGIQAATLRDVWRFIHSAERSEQDLENELERMGLTPGLWESFVIRFRNSEQSNKMLMEFLQSIRESHGVLLYATSNNNRGNAEEFSAMLERFGVDQVVERVLLSSELGATKPDPEFWVRARHFCEKLGVVTDDAQILVIDDDARNCQSAQDLGLQAIQYSQFDDAFIANVRGVLNGAALQG